MPLLSARDRTSSGFCDGDPRNDLTLASGTALGEGEDPTVFIDSWQVPNTTSYISQSRRRELNCSTSDCSACFDMLQNPAFLSCHAFVSPLTKAQRRSFSVNSIWWLSVVPGPSEHILRPLGAR